MNRSESLKEIERRAYRSTFEDGIYDIQFGLLFLVFAWIAILEAIGISRFIGYSLFVIPLIFPWLAKRYITIPRMGSVEFGSKRKSKRRLSLLIGAIIILLTLPLIIMIAGQSIEGQTGWLLIAMFAMPVFVIAVYFMDFPRLWIYAALLIAGVLESELLLGCVDTPYNTLISFGIPGVIILLIGLALLIRFVRKHPRPDLEARHVS
jgi:hypothetical protein